MLVRVAVVSHLALSVPVVVINYECLWSIHGDDFFTPDFFRWRPWVPLVPVSLDLHKSLLHHIMHISPVLPLPYSFFLHLEIYFPIHTLHWGSSPKYAHKCPWVAGSTFWVHCRSYFFIFFSASTSVFMTKRSLQFPWWLVSVGSLGLTCTPYGINNSLTLGLKFLKKVEIISNGNTMSCGGAIILKRNWV